MSNKKDHGRLWLGQQVVEGRLPVPGCADCVALSFEEHGKPFACRVITLDHEDGLADWRRFAHGAALPERCISLDMRESSNKRRMA
jgi:hypothetical protein